MRLYMVSNEIYKTFKTKLDEQEQNGQKFYYLGDKKAKPYQPDNVEIGSELLWSCFEYAFSIANEDKQREYRSGGLARRNKLQIFWDAFRGKVAECHAKVFYEHRGCRVRDIDFDIYDRGVWDRYDLIINDKIVSIKSSKHFSQLLMLETEDWKDGKYSGDVYDEDYTPDYFMFIRTRIDVPKELERGDNLNKERLWQVIQRLDITAEISGLLPFVHFIDQVIKYKYVIRQNEIFKASLKSRGVRMDADNYYVKISELNWSCTLL